MQKYTPWAWVALTVGLALGLLVRFNTITTWNLYAPLWITEAVAFMLFALFLLEQDSVSFALGAALGSAVWLVNQVLCWYGYGNTILLSGFTVIYWLTAIAEITILISALLTTNAKSRINTETVGIIGFAIMAVFSVWKFEEIYRNFVYGTPVFISATCWGAGILLMSIGSALQVRYKHDAATVITYAGLMVALYASLAFGLAMSVTGT